MQAATLAGVVLALMLAGCSTAPARPAALVDFPVATGQLTRTTLFRLELQGQPTLEIGHVAVGKGVRLPAQGSVSLPVHDLGIMLEGSEVAQIGDASVELRARQLAYLRPNVPQSSLFTAASRLVFLFLGEPVDDPGVPKPPGPVENSAGVMIWTRQDLAAASAPVPILKVSAPENPTLHIGVVQAPAGTRMPVTEDLTPPAYHVEIIITGTVETTIAGQATTLHAGDILRLPPGTRPTARFLEDTELVCISYGAAVPLPSHSGS